MLHYYFSLFKKGNKSETIYYHLKKGSRMNDQLVDRIESNPKYKELVSKRNSFALKLGIFILVMFYSFIVTVAFNKELFATKVSEGAMTTIGFPIALAILVISFITTLIYVRRANTEFEGLINDIKKDVKDII